MGGQDPVFNYEEVHHITQGTYQQTGPSEEAYTRRCTQSEEGARERRERQTDGRQADRGRVEGVRENDEID